jgi:hypothetical protein
VSATGVRLRPWPLRTDCLGDFPASNIEHNYRGIIVGQRIERFSADMGHPRDPPPIPRCLRSRMPLTGLNISNTRSGSAGAIPMPESRIETVTAVGV